MKKSGIELIAQERSEQIEKHGKSIQHDKDTNFENQLIDGAIGLLEKDFMRAEEQDVADAMPDGWDPDLWFKMFNKSYKERLIIAGALIAAEIDRYNAYQIND